MNKKKLKQIETDFLIRYPGGFENIELVEIGKKHRMTPLISFAQESFHKKKFIRPGDIVENMATLISRSSMISMFEKPKFKSFINGLSTSQRKQLVNGLNQQLNGNQQRGFESVLQQLKSVKLAKWSLITGIPVYFHPHTDYFVKPTTTKNIIEFFELKQVKYSPTPSWEFYADYREILDEMKAKVDSSLAPNNATFTGMLMMALGSNLN